MRVGWRGGIAIGCALGAAVFWGINLALWQPSTERSSGLVFFSIAENNTYWARDLRFCAVVAIVLAVLLAGRGGRLSRWAGLAVGAAWIGADLILDRADVGGDAAAAIVAVAGGVAAVAGTGVVLRRTTDAPPHHRALVCGAAIAAALAPLAAGIESPTDTEAALTPAALILGALLAVLASALALAAATGRSVVRLATTGVLAVATVAGLGLTRLLEPGSRLAPMMLLGAVLLAGVAVLTGEPPRGVLAWLRQLPKLLVLLVLYPALVLFTLLVTVYLVPVPSWFTALAGSVPVNAADSDTLYALVGVTTGYLIGWLLLAIDRALVMPAAVAAPEVEAAVRS